MLPTIKVAIEEAVADQTSTDQVTDQETDQVNQLLSAMTPKLELAREVLMERLNLKHRPTFRTNYLNPALEADLVELTQPNAPNSPTQRYRLTNRGQALRRPTDPAP